MNCSITIDDFDRSLSIFGTSEPILKGRMTAPSPTSHTTTTLDVPAELRTIHKKVKLYIDLFYVNSLIFLAVKSDDINYLSIDHMKNRKATTILKHLENIIKKYTTRGFIVTDIFGDGEFDVHNIVTSLLPATLHICSADEHIPKIERTIRTIKEHA